MLSDVLEALIVIRGLIVQKTKLIGDCNRLLKDLLDSLLLESNENKRLFIQACIGGLQIHGEDRKGRNSLVCSLLIFEPLSLFFHLGSIGNFDYTLRTFTVLPFRYILT